LQLQAYGFDLSNVSGGSLLADGSRLHVAAYVRLRNIVQAHILNGNLNPTLSESPEFDGGYAEVERRGGFLALLIQENAACITAYNCQAEEDLRHDMDLAEEWQDDLLDVEWAHEDGINNPVE
jgi:hypothetical protein